MASGKNTNSKDIDLNKLAEEELLRESKRALARAEVSGIDGFKKCSLPKSNKTFLTNTIVSNMKMNKIKEAKLLKRMNLSSIKQEDHSSHKLKKKKRKST